MELFEYRFRVHASLEAVSFFHQSTHVLKRLTPPPLFVQIHCVEPLAEGSRSEFTLWFGPLPLRWTAIHSAVDPKLGFTDTQTRGPMKSWQHRHEWHAVDPHTTMVTERIQYEHHAGVRGLLTRLLFARPLLKFMFAYRRWVIRRGVKDSQE